MEPSLQRQPGERARGCVVIGARLFHLDGILVSTLWATGKRLLQVSAVGPVLARTRLKSLLACFRLAQDSVAERQLHTRLITLYVKEHTTSAASMRQPQANMNGEHRIRVRTGCLTCRSRKVKCDVPDFVPHAQGTIAETLSRKPSQSVEIAQGLRESAPRQSIPSNGVAAQTSISPDSHRLRQRESIHDAATPETSLRWQGSSFQSHHVSVTDLTDHLRNALQSLDREPIPSADLELDSAVDCPSTYISRDIRLTTTMDLLTASEDPLQSLLSFFIDHVEHPLITPYDQWNWTQMKAEAARLGQSEPAIMLAIMAVSALYKAQIYGLSRSKALSFHHASKREYAVLSTDSSKGSDLPLLAAFLLCIFTTIQYDTHSVLKTTNAEHDTILTSFVQTQVPPQSPLSRRIIVWFSLLEAAAMRGGHAGLLSETLSDALPRSFTAMPNLPPLPDQPSPPAAMQMYEFLSGPVLTFYLTVQSISLSIAKLTHYHRSRATGQDQDQVAEAISHIKTRLRNLWETRSPVQRQTPLELSTNLAPAIAGPLITLVGICEAAYHAEFVEMHRLLGDPVTEPDEEVKVAMRRIRKLVDGGSSCGVSAGDHSVVTPFPDSNVYGNSTCAARTGDSDTDFVADDVRRDEYHARNSAGYIRAAYLRPLFLYAIECMDREQNAWAVARLREINDPICRSAFFAAFAEALGDMQLRKSRRVTSKYFSIWHFGVPPPFL
ncbi:hypothetical protein PV08_05843 [Exophiala spinifera]|uniref:Zn(2)-C6 fungal-type domain-containing protein n=1 Tax=Exophiala spinifera TaxID=91928 RepID=A0A0D2B9W4_9EURO|nr:uncharacterized protein PV08_05843 [Exophiala spinifera]KIW15793.1 hypothetical protein PV08_05843 [Exophiala spinifera]